MDPGVPDTRLIERWLPIAEIGGVAGRVAGDGIAARLVLQAGECAGQAAEAAASRRVKRALRDGGCREGDERLRGPSFETTSIRRRVACLVENREALFGVLRGRAGTTVGVTK